MRRTHQGDRAAASARTIRFVLGAVVACAVLVAMSLPVAASPAPTRPDQTEPTDPTGPADEGTIGLRLVDAPAATADDPRTRLYIVDHLPPGSVISRRIELTNTTDATVHVELYAAAARIVDGAFVGDDGDALNDLSTWTNVAPSSIDIAPGELPMATVTITVPDDAAPGEQYGVVWAEVRAAAPDGGGVAKVSRVGIRLYVSVGPGGAPAADFELESLTARRDPDGRPQVVATVRNTGGRALDMHGTLDLSDGPGGLSAGPFPATLGTTLAVGATEPVLITLDKQLPAGPWRADLALKSGLVQRTGTADISFPETGSSSAVELTGGDEPNWLLRAALAVAVVALLVRLFLRDRKRRRRGRHGRHGRPGRQGRHGRSQPSRHAAQRGFAGVR